MDWVFAEIEEAVILEDDCFPNPSFSPSVRKCCGGISLTREYNFLKTAPKDVRSFSVAQDSNDETKPILTRFNESNDLLGLWYSQGTLTYFKYNGSWQSGFAPVWDARFQTRYANCNGGDLSGQIFCLSNSGSNAPYDLNAKVVSIQ